jgi:hypothetical protein
VYLNNVERLPTGWTKKLDRAKTQRRQEKQILTVDLFVTGKVDPCSRVAYWFYFSASRLGASLLLVSIHLI